MVRDQNKSMDGWIDDQAGWMDGFFFKQVLII
jgi:hypothetical protein